MAIAKPARPIPIGAQMGSGDGGFDLGEAGLGVFLVALGSTVAQSSQDTEFPQIVDLVCTQSEYVA